MKCVLLGIAAVIGLFALAESLTCKKCSVSVFKICLMPSTIACTTNSSVCTATTATFSSIPSFTGFSSLNCLESSQCNATTSGSILGAEYIIQQACCSTDKCNTLQSSGTSYVHFSVSAVLSAALLACVWGQSVY